MPRDRERPKVADLMAGNATVLATEGQPIGRAHFVDVTTFEGARKYRGGPWVSRARSTGSATDSCSCSASPWTPPRQRLRRDRRDGPVRGARGSAVEDFRAGVEDRRKRTFTVPVNVTFVP